MKEIWKDIDGYEGRYQVSNCGRVKSLERYTSAGNYLPGMILKQRLDADGYHRVNLAKDGIQSTVAVHRLVALAFIENHERFCIVNHKDEDKANNCALNLEWCTASYNATYGNAVTKRMKRIAQIATNGEVVQYWRSAADIQESLGFNQGNVGRCARGRSRYAYGFMWAFA